MTPEDFRYNFGVLRQALRIEVEEHLTPRERAGSAPRLWTIMQEVRFAAEVLATRLDGMKVVSIRPEIIEKFVPIANDWVSGGVKVAVVPRFELEKREVEGQLFDFEVGLLCEIDKRIAAQQLVDAFTRDLRSGKIAWTPENVDAFNSQPYLQLLNRRFVGPIAATA